MFLSLLKPKGMPQWYIFQINIFYICIDKIYEMRDR